MLGYSNLSERNSDSLVVEYGLEFTNSTECNLNINMKVMADKNHKANFSTLSPMMEERRVAAQKRSLKGTQDDVQRCSIG